MPGRVRTKYETRLFLQLFEDACNETPERPFCLVPKGDRPRDGYHTLTFARIRELVDGLAHFIDNAIPRNTREPFLTVSYVGPSDFRYTLMQYACVKCKVKVLLPSLRNTPEVNAHLMNTTKCEYLFHANERVAVAKQIKEVRKDLQLITAPDLADTLDEKTTHEPYPYDVEFTEGLNHPVAVLHSSGSTGPPKPITVTNGFLAAFGAERSYKAPPGRVKAEKAQHDFGGKGGNYLSAFPPFHLAGLTEYTYVPIYTLGTPVWLSGNAPPTAEGVLEALEIQKCKGAYLPPSIIESIYHMNSGSKVLANLEWLFFAGGPLSDVVGDHLTQFTRVGQWFGSTETMKMAQLLPAPENWAYLEFHPDALLRMEATDEGVYELVALADPNASETDPGLAFINHSVPGVKEYHTRDLFVQHQEKPNLWKFYGRKDDILVLSSGEKINPVGMEVALTSAGIGISGALVAGERKYRPALLLEVDSSLRQQKDLLENIWPTVEQANTRASAAGRISKDLVIISTTDKPFIRAGKGTIIRKKTIAIYEAEIAEAYSRHEGAINGTNASNAMNGTHSTTHSKSNFDEASILASIRLAFQNAGVPGIDDDDTNVFLIGCDSLKAVEVLSTLRKSLQIPQLQQAILYRNPTPSRLARAIINNQQEKPSKVSRDVSELQSLFNSYTLTMKRPQHDSTASRRIAITGTTGFLGSHLLTELYENSLVSSIICLNRSTNAEQRWLESKPSSSTNTSVQFFRTVANEPQLGLNPTELEALYKCHAIVHNAWKVDWLQPASSFAENLHATRELLSICDNSSGSQKPRFIFISSISTANQLNVIPEAFVPDWSAAMPMGYAESKLIGEQLVTQAAAGQHVAAAVLRVGQIAGSSQHDGPQWPSDDAIPSMWRTSRALGLVPEDLEAADWIPVDALAGVIGEVMLQKHETVVYYNLVNPTPTRWIDLLSTLKEWCGPKAKVVSLKDWVSKLQEYDATEAKELNEKPALKVLEYWKDTVANQEKRSSIAVENARKDLKSFAALSPISKDLLKLWLTKNG